MNRYPTAMNLIGPSAEHHEVTDFLNRPGSAQCSALLYAAIELIARKAESHSTAGYKSDVQATKGSLQLSQCPVFSQG